MGIAPSRDMILSICKYVLISLYLSMDTNIGMAAGAYVWGTGLQEACFMFYIHIVGGIHSHVYDR